MPSEPLLDVDALLEPIPGDAPAGEPVAFMLRQQFEDLRKSIDPDEFAPDDPQRPEVAKDPDWPGIIQLARQTLTESSKDLLVAARLTEAMASRFGVVGLRDGVLLLLGMVEQCWDRLHPIIEDDDDLEARAAPFDWLDDPDRGSRFPTTVRMLPMLPGEDGPLSWYDWKQMQSGSGSGASFERAVELASREQCQQLLDDWSAARESLDALSDRLGDRMGQDAPGLSSLRRSIADCQGLAEQILRRKGPGDSEPEGLDDGEATDSSASTGAGASSSIPVDDVSRRVASREQAYRKLAECAELLRKIEPHSPIPYLIDRAIELGAMPFPDLMRALIRESSVLDQMNRELGIKPPDDGF